MRSRSNAVLVACAAAALAAPNGAHAKPLLAVSAEAGGEVVLVDPASAQVVERIKVGPRPRGLKPSRNGKRLLVAVAGPPKAAAGDKSAGLAIVDVAARKVAKQISTPPAPFAVDLSPDERTAFVANSDTNELFLIDVAAGTVAKKAPGGTEPQGLAVRRDGKAVFIAAHGGAEVSAIDPKTTKLLMRIDAGPRPQTILLAPHGDRGFAIDEGLPLVTMIDTRGNAFKQELLLQGLAKTPAPVLQSGVLSPDGKSIYLTTGPGRSVLFVDIATKKVVATVDGVGAFPRGIAISPDGNKLYTANGASNDVAIVDVAGKKVEARVAVPGSPWGVALLK